MSDLYKIHRPSTKRIPVLINSPHSGVHFPEELKDLYLPDRLKNPDDADFEMPRLYNFANEIGATIIEAKIHRWVIDLNRDPESAPLYNDGRLITGLCPITTFEGYPLYKKEKTPNKKEIERRLNTYYWPYYQKVQDLLNELKESFGHVLIYDLHSIRRRVNSISKEAFPDIILGTDDQKSADKGLIDIAVKNFSKSGYSFSHNHPFKGGHITRYFGKPSDNQHALQIERSKDIYMNDAETEFSEERSDKLRAILKPNLIELGEQTIRLKQ